MKLFMEFKTVCARVRFTHMSVGKSFIPWCIVNVRNNRNKLTRFETIIKTHRVVTETKKTRSGKDKYFVDSGDFLLF